MMSVTGEFSGCSEVYFNPVQNGRFQTLPVVFDCWLIECVANADGFSEPTSWACSKSAELRLYTGLGYGHNVF